MCTPISLVISGFAEETLSRHAHIASKANPPVCGPCCTRTSPRNHSHRAKCSRACLCLGDNELEIVTQCRAAEDESAHKKKCQARDTGSCVCIAELCTEKASSPEHRSLALCAHRTAWSSPLPPRRACHGMHTHWQRGHPPCASLLHEDLAKEAFTQG